MSEFPTQRIDPKYKYCAINFKNIADYGSASTHGGKYCMDCLHCANARACAHQALAKPFSLGTHPERMGCRNAFERKEQA